MKIEKLTDNKIRIIINLDDLREKNIDSSVFTKPLETQTEKEIPNWDYAISSVSDKGYLVEGKTVKDSQFKMPLYEFSGA